MNYSFQYIDIILLAMIAGFIFLRLRGILGKKTGFEGKMPTQFEKEFKKFNIKKESIRENFDDAAQKEFLLTSGHSPQSDTLRPRTLKRYAFLSRALPYL